MVSCCLVGLGTRDGVTIGIGLSRALECGVCLHAGPSLRVLHVGGRRLVMKLRNDNAQAYIFGVGYSFRLDGLL
jgi:heterodisulfide reductase subunit C